MFGTNDAMERFWEGEEKFKQDYKDMVFKFLNLSSKPKIYLMVPPPTYTDSYDHNTINMQVINEVLPRLIPQIARELGFKDR